MRTQLASPAESSARWYHDLHQPINLTKACDPYLQQSLVTIWGECVHRLWYGEERRRKTWDIYRRHQPLQQWPCIRSVRLLRQWRGELCVLAMVWWLSKYRSKGLRCVGKGRVVWSLKEQSRTLGLFQQDHVHLQHHSMVCKDLLVDGLAFLKMKPLVQGEGARKFVIRARLSFRTDKASSGQHFFRQF